MVDPAPRAVSPVKLAHVVLRTGANYDAMLRWYQTVLNAEVVYAAPHMAFLTYDDEHHRIAIARMPRLGPADAPRVGMDHIAFTYADIEDMLHTFARLKATGIEPFGSVNHGPTTSMYYRDPDGNRIELQIDNFDDMAEATQLMRETFSVNPIGIDFDPEQAYRALLDGADKAELTRPPGKDAVRPPDPALIAWLVS
jgi:catechol-2,3-dioxygenase